MLLHGMSDGQWRAEHFLPENNMEVKLRQYLAPCPKYCDTNEAKGQPGLQSFTCTIEHYSISTNNNEFHLYVFLLVHRFEQVL